MEVGGDVKTILLVDAKNALWRAESAMSSLSANGKPTGGIHGFLSILLRVVEEYEPKRTVVCWDDWKNGPASRRKLSANYKVRPDNPSQERELAYKRVATQSQDLMRFFSALDVKQAWAPTWEADDVMGTLAKRYGEKKRPVVIFTGDRDLLQCIDKRTTVLRPVSGGELQEENEKTVFETFGVKVSQFIAYKALVGDSSDGYAGVKGIGEKSATAILQKFHDVREVLYNHDKPEWAPLNKRWADLIKANKDELLVCQRLATINCAAPLKFLPRKKDFKAAMKMLNSWQMREMLVKFSKLKLLAWGGTNAVTS